MPTLDRLKHDYPETARRAKAAQVTARHEGWLGRVLAWLESAVTIRRVGADVIGDDAEALLARAGARLDADDLAGAVAVLDGLPQPAAQFAKPWLDHAHARLTLDTALARLSESALRGVATTGG